MSIDAETGSITDHTPNPVNAKLQPSIPGYNFKVYKLTPNPK
jgi:hypothetical protein